jgi:flagellar protein FlgJ
MAYPSNSSSINALDTRGLANLQRNAKSNDAQSIKLAAQQFEALFLQMVLKSMRDATPREGLFDSDQSKMYESLLDQQLAQVMASKRGIGLADIIERQMTRANGGQVMNLGESLPLMKLPSHYATDGALPAWLSQGLQPGAVQPAATLNPDTIDEQVSDVVRGFVSRVLPHANQAAEHTGIPAPFLIAHAALETGWGRYEPRASDGTPSNNLFGIKAGSTWSGATVTAKTVEYVQGVAQTRAETFRAYSSYAESFVDYARLLSSNPRYSGIIGTQDPAVFAGGLQKAGYATDPNYAAKLGRVIDLLARKSIAQAS